MDYIERLERAGYRPRREASVPFKNVMFAWIIVCASLIVLYGVCTCFGIGDYQVALLGI